jgi:hypothetical protein
VFLVILEFLELTPKPITNLMMRFNAQEQWRDHRDGLLAGDRAAGGFRHQEIVKPEVRL